MTWLLSDSFRRHGRASRRSSRDLNKPVTRNRVFERLEDRCLLAQLNLDIQLWTMDPNNPGQKGTMIPAIATNPTKLFQVSQGTSFLVQVVVDDEPVATDPNQNSTGVIALPLNLKWNPNGLNVIHYAEAFPPLTQNPVPIPITNPILTKNLPRLRSVNTFDPDKGADGLRGSTIPQADLTTPIGIAGCNPVNGNNDCRELSLLRFTAQSLGRAPFSAALAGSMSFADGDPLDNNPFAEVQIDVVNASSSLSGFVYIDTDNDGNRDTDPNSGAPIELGVPNVTISLFRQNETVPLKTFTTGSDGFYHFEDLPADTYRIREAQANCLLDGRETLGFVLPGRVPRGIVGQDEFTNIELRGAEHGVDYLFGELGLSPNCINKRMFLTSSPPARETVAQRLGVAAVTVRGTAGADNINIDNDGQVIRVTVNNGPVQEFDIGQVKIVTIDAGGGEDIVTLNGTAVLELACLASSYLTLRRDDVPINNVQGYAIEVLMAENVTVDAGAGQTDLAVMRDSPQRDDLVLVGDTAALSWVNGASTGRAKRFGKVRAISVSGGGDTVNEQAHDYALDLLGDWQ